MSKIVQWKRGNVTVNDTYTGANGEVTIDTTNWNLRVHDGVTAGGYTIESSSGGTTFSNITVNGFANISNVVITDNQIYANTGNIQIQSSNTSVQGLFIRSDNGRLGFNQEPWPNGAGYDVEFGNTSLHAREFYADPDFPTGYQFLTADGDTGLSHAYDTNQGNVSLLRMRHASIEVAKFYDNNTSEIRGNLVVSSDGATFGTFPNAFVQMYGNVDSYQQLIQQNLSDGTSASADFVATADNGDDNMHFIDMGIDGSNYSDPAFFGDVATKNDGYLYVVGNDVTGPSLGNVGNLILGSTNGLVKTFVGNIAQANVVTTASETGFTVNKGAFVVAANSAPAAANSTGTAGTIAWDGDYVYVCVATDTWKRANLSTW